MSKLRELAPLSKITSPRENPIVIVLVVLLIFPLVIQNAYYQHIMILIFLWAFLASSWNMLGGYGENSIGHAAYFGLGAYTSTLLYLRLGITPWIGLFAGACVGGVAGVLIGSVAFRLRGSYYVLTTIAFAEAVKDLFLIPEFTGRGIGLLLPVIGYAPSKFSFGTKIGYYYVGLILMFCVVVVSYLLQNSKLGYQLTAIRENEQAAESLGISVTRCKLKAAGISAFFTAMGGIFYAQYVLYITPSLTMGIMQSVQMIVVSAVGGLGTVFGPIVGSFILIPLAEIIRVVFGAEAPGLHLAVYGLALMLVVLLQPAGILPKLQELYSRYVLKESEEATPTGGSSGETVVEDLHKET